MKWTDEQISKSAKDWETILIGHATFSAAEFIEGAMTEVRDDLLEEMVSLRHELAEEVNSLKQELIEQIDYRIMHLRKLASNGTSEFVYLEKRLRERYKEICGKDFDGS